MLFGKIAVMLKNLLSCKTVRSAVVHINAFNEKVTLAAQLFEL